jgi:hypothetical protein
LDTLKQRLAETKKGTMFQTPSRAEIAKEIVGTAHTFMHEFWQSDVWEPERTQSPMPEEMNQALSDYLENVITQYPQLSEAWTVHTGYNPPLIPSHVRLHFDISHRALFGSDLQEVFERGGLDAIRNWRQPDDWTMGVIGKAKTRDDYNSCPSFRLTQQHIPKIKSNLIPDKKSLLSGWVYDEYDKTRPGFAYDAIQIRKESTIIGDTVYFYYFEAAQDLPQLVTLDYPKSANAAGDFSFCVSGQDWLEILGSLDKGENMYVYVGETTIGIETVHDFTNINRINQDLLERSRWLQADERYKRVDTLEDVEKEVLTWLKKCASTEQYKRPILTWGYTQTVHGKAIATTTDGYRSHIHYCDYPEGKFIQFPRSTSFDPKSKYPDFAGVISSKRYDFPFTIIPKDMEAVIKRFKKFPSVKLSYNAANDPETLHITANNPERGNVAATICIYPAGNPLTFDDSHRQFTIYVKPKYLLDALSGFKKYGEIGFMKDVYTQGPTLGVEQDRIAIIMPMSPLS